MNGSEMILLAFILIFCGGISCLTTLILIRLLWEKVKERGLFIEVKHINGR